MKKIIAWVLIVIGVAGVLEIIYGIYLGIDLVRNMPNDVAFGVLPNEIGIGIFGLPFLIVGIIMLNLKKKPQ